MLTFRNDLKEVEIGYRRALLDAALREEWDEWNGLRLEFADLLQELDSPEERAARVEWKIDGSGDNYVYFIPNGFKLNNENGWVSSCNQKDLLGFPVGSLSPAGWSVLIWKKNGVWGSMFNFPDTNIHPLGLLSLFPELEYSL